jgi:hypothetical protein
MTWAKQSPAGASQEHAAVAMIVFAGASRNVVTAPDP